MKQERYDKAWFYWRSNRNCEMTKTEWVGWWEATGEFNNRGPRSSNVSMCRIDPEKPWALDNIELMNTAVANRLKAKRRQDAKRI